MRRLDGWRAGLVAVWIAAAIAACAEPQCPSGYYKEHKTCYRLKDAGAEVDSGDLEDDGNAARGDDDVLEGGIAGDDDVASGLEAGQRLGRPEIEGAASMAPGRELWTWNVPAGTDHFEVLINDIAPASGRSQEAPRFSAPLELGDHMLKVRACGPDRLCSDWAVHTARVESFGAQLPRGLRDAARTVPSTALGHRVAIGCNDCADGPNSEVYNLEQATASVERAIDRGADLIELNVASISGALYASPGDSPSAGTRPLLADLLRREAITKSNALIALEVVENTPAASDALAPGEFAKALLAVIDAAPSTARNGRPLWLRTNHANRAYLQALSAEAQHHAVTGPYVRFIVSDPGTDPATFYGSAMDSLIPGLDFLDAVSVDFRSSNLPFRMERIRTAGSAVILENVPGPGHGEIVLGALRELADAFLTSYRVDQARNLVARPDVGALFRAVDISRDARILTIHGIRGGSAVSWERELGRSFDDLWFSANVLSIPNGMLESADGRFFGAYLSFKSTTYAGVLPLANPDLPREPSPGFLMSFMGTLPVLASSYNFFGSWPSSGDGAMWNAGVGAQPEELVALLATPEPAQGQLKDRATIRVRAQGGMGCASLNQPFTATLKEGEVRWITLSYDGSDLTLLIDGKCAGTAWAFNVVGEQDLSAATTIGTGLLGAYYQGSVQQFAVLRWRSSLTDGEN